MKTEHPMQPLYKDEHGTIRFKPNAICRYLVHSGKADLNELAIMSFSREDRVQFAQLIGYSLGGFGELSYVFKSDYDKAEAQLTKAKKRRKK